MPLPGIPFSDYSRGRRHFLNEGQVMHGMCIDDVYHVDRTLAQGPGGITELVSVGTAGPFVRKKIPPQLAHRRVWASLAECSSPRLPNVETTYELPDCFVVVYDYVPGETLEDRVTGKGCLGEGEAVLLASQICEAVQALHEHGIFHRDLSPTNVVIAADGAHLIDLGIARMHRENTSRDTTPLGTYGFAAPEQYGFAQSDERTDVYSIGRLLGYMLTGEKPNDESSAYDDALADEARVPARLRRVMERACNFEPSARYQSAADLASALAGADVAQGEVGADSAQDGAHDAGGAGQATPTPDSKASRASGGQPSTGTQDTQVDGARPHRPATGHGRLMALLVVFFVALSLALGIGWYTTWRYAILDRDAGESQQDDAAATMATNTTTNGGGETPSEADDSTTTGSGDGTASGTAGTDQAGASTGSASGGSTTASAPEQDGAADSDTAEPQASDAASSDSSTSDQSGETAAVQVSASGSASASTASSKPQASAASSKAPAGDTADAASQEASSTSSTPAASGTTITPVASMSQTGLQLGQTLWTVGDDGYLKLAVEFVNTSTGTKYIAPQVHIVARTQDGSVLLSADEGVMCSYPGSSAWKYTTLYVGQEPASVEIALDDSSLVKISGSAAPCYSVSNVHFVTDAAGWSSITGDVSCTEKGSASSSERLALTLVLRDADGSFVGGAFGVVDRPDYSQTQDFSILLTEALPDYDSYEIYAQVW